MNICFKDFKLGGFWWMEVDENVGGVIGVF